MMDDPAGHMLDMETHWKRRSTYRRVATGEPRGSGESSVLSDDASRLLQTYMVESQRTILDYLGSIDAKVSALAELVERKSVLEQCDSQEAPSELEQWRADRASFESMRQKLLRDGRLRGKYVAIYQGKLVGSSCDRLRLLLRLTARFGDVPLFVGRVETRTAPRRIASPRRYKSA